MTEEKESPDNSESEGETATETIAEPTGESASNKNIDLTSTNILIIEADQIDSELLRQGMRGYQYNINISENCRQGFRAALTIPPDAILMNPESLEVDIDKAIRLFKSIEPLRKTPIALILNLAAQDIIVKSIRSGASNCFSKENSIHMIHLKIEKLLQKAPKEVDPIFEHLEYEAVVSKDQLQLKVLSNLDAEACKELVQLVRMLNPIMPVDLVISFEKVESVVTSAIGYFNDISDSAKAYDGKLLLSNITPGKYPANVERVFTSSFENLDKK